MLTSHVSQNWFQNRRAKQRKLNGHPNPFVPQYHIFLKDQPKAGKEDSSATARVTPSSAPVTPVTSAIITRPNQLPLTSPSSSFTTNAVPWIFPMSGGISPYYTPLSYSLAAPPTSTIVAQTTPSPILGTVHQGYQYTNPAATLLQLTPPDISPTAFPTQQDN